uniref:Transmembrane protein n=1 Tax=Anguilla anguilla TaxID=7936 RepID=A0A0E9X5W0_ANGAN
MRVHISLPFEIRTTIIMITKFHFCKQISFFFYSNRKSHMSTLRKNIKDHNCMQRRLIKKEKLCVSYTTQTLALAFLLFLQLIQAKSIQLYILRN